MIEWYYGKNGQQYGPVDTPTLKRLAAVGELGPSDLIWHEGMAQWVNASQTQGLFAGSPVPPGSGQPDEVIVIEHPAAGMYAAPAPSAPAYSAQQALPYATPQFNYSMQYPGYAPRTSHKGMAMAAMILSICGIVTFCLGIVLGILGIIFGSIAISGMNRTRNNDGRGMATTGVVLGIVDIIGWIFFFISIS